MTLRHTDPDDPEVKRAIDLYLERGVIIPEYAGEIAEAKRRLNEWADEGEPLR